MVDVLKPANLAASTAPTVTDDINAGYELFSPWLDSSNDVLYWCLDNSAGAAVWKRSTEIDIPTSRIQGRVSGGSGAVENLTAMQVKTLLGIDANATTSTPSIVELLTQAELDDFATPDTGRAVTQNILKKYIDPEVIPPAPAAHATKQVDWTPPTADGGEWRVESRRHFQDGLTTTTPRTKVIFRNCRFSGTCSFTDLDQARFINCTIDSVTGTAITLTTCEDIEFDNLIATSVTDEVLRLNSCSNVTIKRPQISSATTSAASVTAATTRNGLFEATGNWSEPNEVHAAIHLEGCTNVAIEKPKLRGVTRTGIFARDSDCVVVKDIDSEGGSDFVSVVGIQFNDEPVMLMDCTNSRIVGGRIVDPGRHAMYICETMPTLLATGVDRLGNTLRNITVEKVYMSGKATDAPGVNDLSYGVIVQGGRTVRILNNDIHRFGETGIEFGSQGTDDALAEGNTVTACGQNTGLVHFDGISFQCGRGFICRNNTFEDNYRNGIQLKPGYLQAGGFKNEYPCQDALIDGNKVIGNGRGAEGYGINLLDSGGTSNRQFMDRIRVCNNTVYGNARENFLCTLGTGKVRVYDNNFGACDGINNLRVTDSYGLEIYDNYIHHNKPTASQYYAIRVDDAIGPVTKARIYNNDMQAFDLSALNRRNTDWAVEHATDPLTDTLATALAAANTAEARTDIYIYNYLGATTGGASDVRDVSEITNADKADVGIWSNGDAPVALFGNQFTDFDIDVLVEDQYKIEPFAEKATSQKNTGAGGPTWGSADPVYVTNGADLAVLSSDGDTNTEVNDVEGMLKAGWRWHNSLPSTGDHPGGQAIADSDIEAFSVLVTAPT